ncbi:MAG: hypothetical protein LC539_11490 [Candidatus Thiodiazotropha sp.]|nr:hypothetical protein [Candidatus Thiodiazotropha sp.]MCM8920623.1 hypothetical protein [Candidatus Thiodiazotropha sp.]
MENVAKANREALPTASHTATFGISEAILEWAHRHDCLPGLLLLIDTGLLHSEPDLVGTFLRELADPTAICILDQWAPRLHGLIDPVLQAAHATLADPSILKLTSPLTLEKSPATQLRGRLNTLYLVAMSGQHNPYIKDETVYSWYRQLRIWLLLQAIPRTLRGNNRDKNVRKVATRLRLAGEINQPESKEMVMSLKGPASTFSEMNQTLIRHADQHLIQTDSSREQQFLRAIGDLALGKQSPKDVDQEDPHSDLFYHRFEIIDSPVDVSNPPVSEWLPETSVEAFPDTHWHTDTETSDAIIDVGVDARSSYTHQRLQANSVLLASSEARHQLPWSWHQPSAYEKNELDRWIVQLTKADAIDDRILGALLWISVHTGRSLRRCLDIQIAEHPSAEWTLAPDMKSLRRLPPQRQSHWTPKTDEECRWVTPVAPSIRIELPNHITAILLPCTTGGSMPESLGDLWLSFCNESAKHQMLQKRPKSLNRVTPGMLENPLGQRLFQETGDSLFARLLSSHPQSGLPGAFAYPHWSQQEAQAILADTTLAARAKPGKDLIGAGSWLAPVVNLLKAALERAYERLVISQRSGDLVTYHNLLTAYQALCLWAATGIRPTRDPLEDPSLLDPEDGFIYIVDKDSGGARMGRLVPLPRSLHQVLTQQYPVHLATLSEMLRDTCPRMAEEIHTLSRGVSTGTMPYLFQLVVGDKGLSWLSLSESRIRSLDLFDCPLPLRLFRHRCSNDLRRRGVDPEIIDGLLGHAELGAASYSDYSTRCWQQDMETARPQIEASYAVLGLRPLPDGALPPLPDNLAETEVPQQRAFGLLARQQRRRKDIKSARFQAENTIVEHTQDTPLIDMDEEAIEALSRALLFRSNGLPKPDGMLQYAYLVRKIDRLWQEQGKRVKLPHRYALHEEDRSPFKPSAVGALSWLRHILETWGTHLHSQSVGRTSYQDCRLLGTVLLCLECRLTDRRILNTVLDGKSHRLVRYMNQDYLEFSEKLDTDAADPPVRRFPLTSQVAVLLARSSLSSRKIHWDNHSLPDWLKPLAESMPKASTSSDTYRMRDLLEDLTSLMDQVNVITLPGIVAGYLAGRVLSAGLGWMDWVRLDCEKIIAPPKNETTEVEEMEGDPADTIKGATTPPDAGGADDERLHAAHHLLGEVATILKAHFDMSASSMRRDIRRKIKAVLQSQRTQVSSAIHLLVGWTQHLLTRPVRGSRRKKPRMLATRTVYRYFNTLSPRFLEVGYDIDLLSLDSDGLTDFYEEILACRPTDNPAYLGNRLAEFHQWARDVGIDEPDWAELPLAAAQWAVRPGYITEKDYQTALQHLRDYPGDERVALFSAFLLLLCYRFGLRRGEALGLQRREWVEADGSWVVRVRKNQYRKLKRPASKRHVPLLFSLSDLEQRVIREVMAMSEASHGDDELALLFSDVGEARQLPDTTTLVDLVLQVLKAVTGNPGIVIHHARHSAGCRVAHALYGLGLPMWVDPFDNKDKPNDFSHSVQETLLGRIGVTRRAPWALAIFMGHASPVTALRSYLHFLPEWCAHHLTLPLNNSRLCPDKIICLDNLPVAEIRETPVDTTHHPVPPTPLIILKLMRLISRGHNPDKAREYLGLAASDLLGLVSALDHIGSETRFILRKDEPEMAYSFLTRVTENGWQRMELLALEAIDSDRNPEVTLSPKMLINMISASRQILLWSDVHFNLVRSILDYYAIPDSQIVMTYNETGNNDKLTVARKAGFQPIDSMAAGTGKKAFQIDGVFAYDEYENRPVHRFCLLPKLGIQGVLRNRLGLILMLLAFSIASMHSETQTSG